jgi:hypothetical protein
VSSSDDTPECPAALRYLWVYFVELSEGLAITGMAPPVITWESLAAWCELRRMVIEPWESLALVRLGRLRAEIQSEKKPGNN